MTKMQWNYGMAEVLGTIRETLNKWASGKLTPNECIERIAWAVTCLDIAEMEKSNKMIAALKAYGPEKSKK